MKLGPVVQEEMSFKEKVYGRTTDDGQRPITIAHIEPSAKKRWLNKGSYMSAHVLLNFFNGLGKK